MPRVFCLFKCAEFLFSMPSSRAKQFPVLAVRATRFLLTQTAMLSRNNDCELAGVSYILDKARILLQRGIEVL